MAKRKLYIRNNKGEYIEYNEGTEERVCNNIIVLVESDGERQFNLTLKYLYGESDKKEKMQMTFGSYSEFLRFLDFLRPFVKNALKELNVKTR